MKAKDKLGFDLEFAQRPWKPGGKQGVFSPAFVHPRPKTNERVERLRRIRVVVDDLEKPLGILERVFNATRLEWSFGQGGQCSWVSIAHVILGNLELQYCQPLKKKGLLYEFLTRGGKGVFSLTLGVKSIKDTLEEMVQKSKSVASGTPLDTVGLYGSHIGQESTPDAYLLNSRSILGFDIELEE